MSNIVSFSNMTIEEFIDLNINNIPPEIIEKLKYIKQLEDENEKLHSKIAKLTFLLNKNYQTFQN